MIPVVPCPLPRCRSRSGGSLIEILVACLILAVVAVGTAACLYLSQGATAVQRNRRTALELANSRLEELRSAPYASICPSAGNANLFYIDRLTGNWRVTGAYHDESVLVNGRARRITTTVRRVDADGGAVSWDCVRLAVSIAYGSGPLDVVTLETLESP